MLAWVRMVFVGATGAPSGRFIVIAIAIAWLLALGALLVHISRFSARSGSVRVIDLAGTEQPLETVARSEQPVRSAAADPQVKVVRTTVVPASSATQPAWDPSREAWVSTHPEFGVLVLNPETNRWLAD